MRCAAAIFLTFATIACSNPATAPSPNDTAARIDVPLILRIGQQVRATSTVVLGRGGTQLLTTGWRSDTPAVATITDQGIVTATSSGRAVISVPYAGERRRQAIRVVPDFEGFWTGTFRVTQCTWSPVFLSSWCSGLDNAAGPITFVLSQKDEFVTGTFATEDVTYPAFVVSITDNGLLEITSRAVTAPARVTSASWSLTSSRPGHMDGILVWLRSGIGGLNGYGLAEGTVVLDR